MKRSARELIASRLGLHTRLMPVLLAAAVGEMIHAQRYSPRN